MNHLIKDIFIEENNNKYDILIGKNALGNDYIIKMSHPESLWMHINNVPSAHVILQSKGDIIPKRYINQVASILFEYTKKAPKNSYVIYTKIKHVKLTNVLGTVIPTQINFIKF